MNVFEGLSFYEAFIIYTGIILMLGAGTYSAYKFGKEEKVF